MIHHDTANGRGYWGVNRNMVGGVILLAGDREDGEQVKIALSVGEARRVADELNRMANTVEIDNMQKGDA